MVTLKTNNGLWLRLKRLFFFFFIVSWALLTKFLKVRKLRMCMCLLLLKEGGVLQKNILQTAKMLGLDRNILSLMIFSLLLP